MWPCGTEIFGKGSERRDESSSMSFARCLRVYRGNIWLGIAGRELLDSDGIEQYKDVRAITIGGRVCPCCRRAMYFDACVLGLRL